MNNQCHTSNHFVHMKNICCQTYFSVYTITIYLWSIYIRSSCVQFCSYGNVYLNNSYQLLATCLCLCSAVWHNTLTWVCGMWTDISMVSSVRPQWYLLQVFLSVSCPVTLDPAQMGKGVGTMMWSGASVSTLLTEAVRVMLTTSDHSVSVYASVSLGAHSRNRR